MTGPRGGLRFSRRYTNRLQQAPDDAELVVVIDVLRSFTSAAIVLERGARCVYPVPGGIPPAYWRRGIGPAVSVGSLPGGDPAPGFDFGNSPAALSRADVAGQAVILSTAAGVAGLLRHRHAPRLYAASLGCARATAEAIRASGVSRICFVITGEWVDRDGDEDIACADYLEALLRGETVTPERFERRVRDSDFGRRFAAGDNPHLSAADLDLAARIDCHDFAMPVRRAGARLIIVRA